MEMSKIATAVAMVAALFVLHVAPAFAQEGKEKN
jgi:hypothetical protein